MTRQEIADEFAQIKLDLTELNRELRVINWMLGVVLIGVMLPILREFIALGP